MLLQILLTFLAMNILAFAMFGWDKRQARRGGWRVRESTLLLVAFLGGTPGAFAGRALFRHKTRKQPFVAALYVVVGMQVLGLAFAYWHFFLR